MNNEEKLKEVEKAGSAWLELQSEVILLSVQTNTVFEDKQIQEGIQGFRNAQNLSRLAETIAVTEENDLCSRILPLVDEMRAQLDNVIGRMSKEISPEFMLGIGDKQSV